MELFSFYQYIGVWTSLIIALALWDLVWKAIALWRAAARKEVIWFIVLLVLNTAGILPIIYLIFKPAPGDKSLVSVVSEKTSSDSKKVVAEKSAAKKNVLTKKVTKKKTSSKKLTKSKSKPNKK